MLFLSLCRNVHRYLRCIRNLHHHYCDPRIRKCLCQGNSDGNCVDNGIHRRLHRDKFSRDHSFPNIRGFLWARISHSIRVWSPHLYLHRLQATIDSDTRRRRNVGSPTTSMIHLQSVQRTPSAPAIRYTSPVSRQLRRTGPVQSTVPPPP